MTPALQSGSAVVADDLAYIRERLREEWPHIQGKRLLITGGAGFLGYYLVQAAMGPGGAEVTVCDSFLRGLPAWLREFGEAGSVRLVQHDIAQPPPEDLGEFDYAIHAASIASPIYYRKHPIETMDANVGGLRHLLNRCLEQQKRGQPLSGLLFFSTSEIYGDPDAAHIPTPETYRGYVSCTGPRACYDESKRYGETLAVNFAREYGVPVTIARPFNNYGPGLRLHDGRVIPDFARNILANKNIQLLSDGSPTRTFCYVADAVTGYYKILLRGRPGEAYNIGAERPEISTAELAAKMRAIAEDACGYRGQVVRASSADRHYLTDNPQRRCPRLEKAREELGYEPRIPLEEGLTRTLFWYRDHPHAREASA